ncbi:hypothetical protein [Victivallis sp. Marseille-Q1083]|uniref:hypothetical protein n=1 Tax=Victivallis sp. Marseille-Q1083 TaxID=2717288 RepID=UPI00158AD816|nr:hypothetical protein [Victivallis sp. Marseille-Q1083]
MIESAEEFVRLRESEIEEEYERAATDELPLNVCLDIIARFPHKKQWVVINKTVPIEILELLADDEDVRFEVATKRKLTRDLFLKLSKDPDATVRERIACNAKTPIDILRGMYPDEWDYINETLEERIKAYEEKKNNLIGR